MTIIVCANGQLATRTTTSGDLEVEDDANNESLLGGGGGGVWPKLVSDGRLRLSLEGIRISAALQRLASSAD